MKPNNPVTPEMLEAGAEAAAEACRDKPFSWKATAKAAYLAMVEQGPDVEAMRRVERERDALRVVATHARLALPVLVNILTSIGLKEGEKTARAMLETLQTVDAALEQDEFDKSFADALAGGTGMMRVGKRSAALGDG